MVREGDVRITKTAQIVVWPLMGVLVLACLNQAQGQTLTKEISTALRHFLVVDCAIAQEQDSFIALAKAYAALDSTSQSQVDRQLQDLLTKGPSAKDLDRFEKSLNRQWESRDAFLKKHPRLGLKKDYLEIATKTGKEAFIAERRAEFILRQRTRAAFAVAATGSPEGIKRLSELRETMKDEALREAIIAALARYQKSLAPKR